MKKFEDKMKCVGMAVVVILAMLLVWFFGRDKIDEWLKDPES